MPEKASAHLIRWAMGGVLYGLLEILWRGHTHWTMMLLAAILCIPLDIANEHIPWEFPLWLQAVLGGTAITAAELAAGPWCAGISGVRWRPGWCSMSGSALASGITPGFLEIYGARFALNSGRCGVCWPGR